MRKIQRLTQLSQSYQDYLDKTTKNYKELQIITHAANQEHYQEQWDHFNAYTSQVIINLVELTKRDQDLLPILAFSLEKISNFMRVTQILRPVPLLTLEQLINQHKNTISTQIKQEIASLAIHIAIRSMKIIEKHESTLNQLHFDCFQCCIYEQNNHFKVLLGFKDLKLASILQEKTSSQLLSQFLQQTLAQMSNKQKIKLQTQTDLNAKFSQLLKVKKIMQENSQKQPNVQITKENSSNSFQFSLYETIMSNFTGHIFDIIHSSIVGLTQIVLNQYLSDNPHFNQQFIRAQDPFTNKSYQGEIYHNLNCLHFEGFSYQAYSSQKYCPICGELFIFNPQRVKQVGRNVFQMLLLHNPINPQSLSLVYHFKHKVFTLKQNPFQSYLDGFTNYYHFQNFIKRTKNFYDRNEVVNYHRVQSINLYNKLEGKKKLYFPDEFVTTPVRGKYCHHWQFYDLKRVYSELKRTKNDYFRCFVCLQEITVEQIIYLEEMSHLIELALKCFTTQKPKQCHCSINVYHQQKIITLSYSCDSRNEQLQLELYETLLDPLSKSRFINEFWADKNIKLTPQFCRFFFGK